MRYDKIRKWKPWLKSFKLLLFSMQSLYTTELVATSS